MKKNWKMNKLANRERTMKKNKKVLIEIIFESKVIDN